MSHVFDENSKVLRSGSLSRRVARCGLSGPAERLDTAQAVEAHTSAAQRPTGLHVFPLVIKLIDGAGEMDETLCSDPQQPWRRLVSLSSQS